jgi:hypothetical protein
MVGGYMKVIKAYSEIICKVYCAICGEKEWFQFERIKDNSNKNVINFEYRTESKFRLSDRLGFIKRSKIANRAWDEKEKFIFKLMPVTLQQLDELYASMYASIESIFSEKEIQYIHNTKVNAVSIDKNHKLFFESQGGLTISLLQDDGIVDNILVGYTVQSENERLRLKKSLFKCIITSNNYFFNKYSGSLTKQETLDFMATINHLLNTVKESSSGTIKIC